MSEQTNQENTTPTDHDASDGGIQLNDGTVWRNAKEVKDSIVNAREALKAAQATQSELASIKDLLSKMQPQQKQQPNGKQDQVRDELTARLDHLERSGKFKDALMGHQLDSSQRQILSDLFEAQKPADPSSWLQEKVKQYNFQASQESIGSDVTGGQVKPAVPNPGASGRTPSGEMVGDPKVFASQNPQAWRDMDPAKRTEWRAQWKRQNRTGPDYASQWPALKRLRK